MILYSSDEAQAMKAIEELGELTAALGRYMHNPLADPKNSLDNIIEEIADCYIMLTQLSIIFGAANVEELLAVKMQHVRNLLEYRMRGTS